MCKGEVEDLPILAVTSAPPSEKEAYVYFGSLEATPVMAINIESIPAPEEPLIKDKVSKIMAESATQTDTPAEGIPEKIEKELSKAEVVEISTAAPLALAEVPLEELTIGINATSTASPQGGEAASSLPPTDPPMQASISVHDDSAIGPASNSEEEDEKKKVENDKDTESEVTSDLEFLQSEQSHC